MRPALEHLGLRASSFKQALELGSGSGRVAVLMDSHFDGNLAGSQTLALKQRWCN